MSEVPLYSVVDVLLQPSSGFGQVCNTFFFTLVWVRFHRRGANYVLVSQHSWDPPEGVGSRLLILALPWLNGIPRSTKKTFGIQSDFALNLHWSSKQ